ncbi:hypothetical protein JTF08_15145 [Micrococcaceae bacterium RIT802]|nr:hypothetical protein [Micrococcaceae bacterium RIT 802]
MKFRLFPVETRGLGLLQQLGEIVRQSVETLSELLGAPADDQQGLIRELEQFEQRATHLHHAVLTHLRTSYVNPLPREDLYTFSRLLNDAVAELAGAGDLMVTTSAAGISRRAAEQLEMLGRQSEMTNDALGKLQHPDDLEDAWLQMIRLGRRARRTHRAWLGEISELSKASTILRHRAVAEQLLAAVDSLHALADHLGRVLVKES